MEAVVVFRGESVSVEKRGQGRVSGSVEEVPSRSSSRDRHCPRCTRYHDPMHRLHVSKSCHASVDSWVWFQGHV
jgi:hypothetical protein